MKECNNDDKQESEQSANSETPPKGAVFLEISGFRPSRNLRS
jgi:hypothetical protein